MSKAVIEHIMAFLGVVAVFDLGVQLFTFGEIQIIKIIIGW